MKKIGFIGQGWIGKNYALDFEERGFAPVRYSKEPEYEGNKEEIATCDIVFVAVPTPTTEKGFDDSIVRDVLSLVGKGKIAVIKSTVVPGTTLSLQKQYPDIFVLNSPEFLTESTARYDAGHPDRNIIGIPFDTDEYKAKAEEVLSVLPHAMYSIVVSSTQSEFVKYAGNCMSYVKVVFVNVLYDLAQKLELDWSQTKEMISADPRIGGFHLEPVHKSGRGAGGHCFIKDFSAFEKIYSDTLSDPKGQAMLKAIEQKNIDLLLSTHKDLDLLSGVYGESILE